MTLRWVLGLARHVLLLCLGGWAVGVHFRYRLSGAWPVVLPWIGVALTALGLLMLLNHVLRAGRREGLLTRLFERLEYWGSLGLLLFGFLSLGVFVNGARDRTLPQPYRAQVVSLARGEAGFGWFPVPTPSWVGLRPALDPRRLGRVLLWASERRRLWTGAPALVYLRAGALGVPWVHAIEPDREQPVRDILRLLPTAREPRRELIRLYLRHHRWDQVLAEALAYRAVHPRDTEFPVTVADWLMSAGRNRDATALLGPVAEQHRDYAVYNALALALARQAPSERAVALLKEAIAMEPDALDAYLHLAQVYGNWGRFEEAIPMYEKTLEFWPGFAWAREELRRLRGIVAERERRPTRAR